MFGYVKALKAEMKFREFERYRSVYCGLCKAISTDYGQLPRLAVSYDLTFLLLLIEALQAENPAVAPETCVLHPLKKHPIAQPDAVLKLGAAIAVLLASSKLDDNVKDGEKRVTTAGLRLITAKAVKKAQRNQPEIAAAIKKHLADLDALEANNNDIELQAGSFGNLLAALAQPCAEAAHLDQSTQQSVAVLLSDLGRWVYLLDALDDYVDDTKSKGRSFIKAPDREAAVVQIAPRLEALEANMEKTAALLPYRRDAGIVANILLDGLSHERALICSPGCSSPAAAGSTDDRSTGTAGSDA